MSNNLSQNKVDNEINEYKGKLLTPFQHKTLVKYLQTNLQREYRCRIEIMLLADMGKSQTQICSIVGCSQEMARYWIALAEAGLAHKWNSRPIGRPKTISNQYLDRLQELVKHSPREYGYAFGSWTAQWLSKHLAQEFDIQVSDRHINRLLKQMGLSTKSKSCYQLESDSIHNTGIQIKDLQSAKEPTNQWSLVVGH
ncbi:hypothetical protein NIES4071_53410 [Calothrix sp. NIES-4071]|nr:hypothetical protein NIES4071_53410 [Calothrix sp. NIES-4071]BAZ59649.1 hypothetical protein NIES4105_53360 [Calothrix sp. NIES-4105]